MGPSDATTSTMPHHIVERSYGRLFTPDALPGQPTFTLMIVTFPWPSCSSWQSSLRLEHLERLALRRVVWMSSSGASRARRSGLGACRSLFAPQTSTTRSLSTVATVPMALGCRKSHGVTDQFEWTVIYIQRPRLARWASLPTHLAAAFCRLSVCHRDGVRWTSGLRG